MTKFNVLLYLLYHDSAYVAVVAITTEWLTFSPFLTRSSGLFSYSTGTNAVIPTAGHRNGEHRHLRRALAPAASAPHRRSLFSLRFALLQARQTEWHRTPASPRSQSPFIRFETLICA